MSLANRKNTATKSAPPSFAVSGKSLQLQLPCPLAQLPTRKIYNPTYFFNETYQHEIANHYRDYKRRTRRIPRRRRHTIYVPYRRAAFYGVVSGQKRPVLPIAVHDFPRFTAVYTTPRRGRRTLCEYAPPDETYNATVRRIRQADSNKELTALVEKQLRWSSSTNSRRVDVRKGTSKNSSRKGCCGRKGLPVSTKRSTALAEEAVTDKYEWPAKQQALNDSTDVNVNGKWLVFNDCCVVDVDVDDVSVISDSAEKVKLSRSKQQNNNKELQKNKHTQASNKRRDSGTSAVYLDIKQAVSSRQSSAVHGTASITYVKRTRQHTDPHSYKSHTHTLSERPTLGTAESFLRLACAYYEKDFLRHINYLQSIGSRNAARRAPATSSKSQATSASSNDESTNGGESITSSATNTPPLANTPRLRSAEGYFHLTSLLQRIGRKRSFKVGCTNGENHNSCAIRVNIKPNFSGPPKVSSRSRNTVNKSQEVTEAAIVGSVTATPATSQSASTLHGRSMNDYLYANLPTANTTSNKISTTTPQTTESARAHFHELIDHLMQLEISDIDASLPKITLTDCSSVGSGAFEGSHAPVDVVQRTTDDNAFAFEFNNAYQSNNFSAYNNKYAATQQTEQKLHEPLVQSTTRHNGFTLKQTKFIGTLQSSLDIPDEGFYYNGEARPP